MSQKNISVWCTKFNSGRENVEDQARNIRLTWDSIRILDLSHALCYL